MSGDVEVEAHVQFHPADRREVVALGVEEQAGEQGLGGLARRRLAGAHDPVDVGQGLVAVLGLVGLQRVADPGAGGDMVDVEQLDPVDPGLVELVEILGRHLVAGLDIDLAGLVVDEVEGGIAAENLLGRDQQLGKAVLGRLVGGARADLLPGREDRLRRSWRRRRRRRGFWPRHASGTNGIRQPPLPRTKVTRL